MTRLDRTGKIIIGVCVLVVLVSGYALYRSFAGGTQ